MSLRTLRDFLSNRLRLELWLLDGKEKHSGEPFVLVYAGGLERHRLYYANLSFRPEWRERSLGREWFWRVDRRAEQEAPDCSMVVYETGPEKEPLFVFSKLLRSPVWLKFEMPVVEKELSRSAKDRRRDMERKIRKHSFTCSTTRSAEDFDYFYHRMYIPYIQNRHGEMSSIRKYELMRKEFLADCELTFLHKDGQRIAGGIVDYSKKNGRFFCRGVLDGSEEIVRMGVSDALFCFELENIRKKGGTTADLGHCRAFFNDGVFRYKIEIGASVGGGHDKPSGLLRFKPLKLTEALRSHWLRNPFVALDKDGRYHGVLFQDQAPSMQGIDEVLDTNFCRGVDRVTIYTRDGSQNRPERSAAGRFIRFAPIASLMKGE